MNHAVLELNDQALLIKNQDGEVFIEPGFALLSEQGIVTGLNARQQAWLQPQNIFRHYWQHLNQTPLSADQQWARHHADIAFAQLKNLYTSAGSPEQLILSVSNTLDDKQLSLLLGLVEAIPATVIAVIDTSLADCLYLADHIQGRGKIEKTTLHIDLHMHQLVVSQLIFERNTARITAHQIIPDIGATHIYNALASYIRDLSINNHRFDPLHTSEGEQTIYDQIPDLLSRLSSLQECPLTLSSPRGNLLIILRKSDIITLMQSHLDRLSSLITRMHPSNITFSHSAKIIRTLSPDFFSARELKQTQGADNCLRCYQPLLELSSDLRRITSIQQTANHTGRRESDTTPPTPATHLLYEGGAWPLDKPISLSIDGKRLNVTQLIDDSAALVLSVSNGDLNIIHRNNDRQIELPDTPQPGGKIFIDDHQLQLIEVFNG